LQSPVSVDFFDVPQRAKLNFAFQQAIADPSEGALQRCQASIDRLAKLNSMIEVVGDDAWRYSDRRTIQEDHLKQSRFFSAIQFKMLSVRLKIQNLEQRHQGYTWTWPQNRTWIFLKLPENVVQIYQMRLNRSN
jgi:hypothetical protein